MSNLKKKHGWVLFCSKTKRYIFDYQAVWIFKTRKEARESKLPTERILKVALDCRGKATVIIGRG